MNQKNYLQMILCSALATRNIPTEYEALFPPVRSPQLYLYMVMDTTVTTCFFADTLSCCDNFLATYDDHPNQPLIIHSNKNHPRWNDPNVNVEADRNCKKRVKKQTKLLKIIQVVSL